MNGIPFSNRIRVSKDGTVSTPGVNYETNRISVLARNKKAIVLKVPGHSTWDGNYSPRIYVPASVMAFKIISEEGDLLNVEPLIEYPVRAKEAK